MTITSNHFRTSTGEKLATFKLTVRLTSDDIATAILSHTGTAYTHDPVEVTEDLIREAVMGMFNEGLEKAGYVCGDNSGIERNGQRPGEALLDDVQQQVIDLAFDGENISPSYKGSYGR